MNHHNDYKPILSILAFSIAVTSLELTEASTIYCVHDGGSNNSQFCFGTPLPTLPAGILPLGPIHKKCDIESLDIQHETDALYAASGDDTPRKGHLYWVNKGNGTILDVGDIVDQENQVAITEVDALSFHPLTGDLWGWGQHTGLFVIDSPLPEQGEPIQAQCLSTPDVPPIAAQVVMRFQGAAEMEMEDITWSWDGTVLYAAENKHIGPPDSHGDPEDRWLLPDFDFDFDEGIKLWAYDTNGGGVIREMCSNLTTEISAKLGKAAEIEALESLPNTLLKPPVPDNQDLLLVGFHGPNKLLYAVIATPPLPLPPDDLPCDLIWVDEIPSRFNDIEGLAYSLNSSALIEAVTVNNIMTHLETLQSIANNNGGSRNSGNVGYDESANYILEQLEGAGYQVTVQPFDFPFFSEQVLPILEQTSPNPTVYIAYDLAGFATLQYSGSDDIEALVEAVDVVIPPGSEPNTSTSGCEVEDFASFTPDRIALIQRGSCAFLTKALNAQAAGATGVIIFNEGQAGRIDAFLGTLQEPGIGIPVVGAHFNVGEELYTLSLSNDVSVHMMVNAISEIRSTSNIIGKTSSGNNKQVVVVGAHLDSVPTGPGINDNGSGSATILEVALQMANLGIIPTNQVQFAFWGAEESGLYGSRYYINQLTTQELNNIALNLNFDMIASPNYVRFVYDGDGSESGLSGPTGSENIENLFLNYFASQGVANCVWSTPLSGNSDYEPFRQVGIPVGGLFTGAGGSKTNAQANCSGGTVGAPYDPNYHTAADDINNVNGVILDEMADAAAHAIFTFAMSHSKVTDLAPSPAVEPVKIPVTTQVVEYLGPFLKQ